MKKIFVVVVAMLTVHELAAQKSYHEQINDYIQQFKSLAIQEQVRSGVPAAITLAQGIHETGAGSSELCTDAANHFGIKCKHNWQGPTYQYSDDAKDECFRKYESARESYQDHSDFLTGSPRYKKLFELDPTDYKGWARGLKQCGYATNPSYAATLIRTIENYQPQQYTLLAIAAQTKDANPELIARHTTPDTDRLPAPNQFTTATHSDSYRGQVQLDDAPIPASAPEPRFQQRKVDEPIEYYEPTRKNGIRGFYARKGDLLLEYAIKHRIRYAKLLEWNDLPDAPLPANLFIYLAPKHKAGSEPTYTVPPGYTLLQISQETGVRLDKLQAYNHLKPGEDPATGAVLSLQAVSAEKPALAEKPQPKPDKYNVHIRTDDEGAYIYTKPKPAPATAEAQDVAPAATAAEISEPANDETFANHPKATKAEAEEASLPKHSAPAATRQELPADTIEAEQQKPEKEMTPLERLKAHMDKRVYGSANETETSITTVPARKIRPENPPAASRETETPRFHTVRSGDTAFSIAKKYGITLQQLKTWNDLPASMVVQKGDRLRVSPR